MPYNDPRRQASIVAAMLCISLGGSGSTCTRINCTQQTVSAGLAPERRFALDLHRCNCHRETGVSFIDPQRVKLNDIR